MTPETLEALRKLPPLDRALIGMRFTSRLEYDQIAVELSLPVEVVKDRMRSALARFLLFAQQGEHT